ncbi:unnamed protein product [Acanthoscelides obtectus]|uniref:Uncharacterized protein n=1 Tax=Acanthoscelides obtectus TaxID=200917 RepID=A0A9P0PPH0_ACAOB|nr:unnamed protein product [Acanthoscelides obtectus]CAK1658979.1 hypothetical protein AOBTE_LOCUS21223 [Acanthoscelides obtectus]
MSRQCPVEEQCRSMHSAPGGLAQVKFQSTNAQTDGVKPVGSVTVFEKAFMDALVEFMKTTHAVMERWKVASGGQELQMSEEERQAKVAELMQMIERKQQEIEQLQKQKQRLVGGVNKTYFAQTQSGTVYCIQECPAECNYAPEYDQIYPPGAGYDTCVPVCNEPCSLPAQVYPVDSGYDLSCVPTCSEPCNALRYTRTCYIRPSGK